MIRDKYREPCEWHGSAEPSWGWGEQESFTKEASISRLRSRVSFLAEVEWVGMEMKTACCFPGQKLSTERWSGVKKRAGRHLEEPSSAVVRHPWVCSEPRQVISASGHKDPHLAVGRESLRVISAKLTMCSETLGQILLLWGILWFHMMLVVRFSMMKLLYLDFLTHA